MFTIFDIAAKRARLSPDATALDEIAGGQRITYRELDDRAARFAAYLRRAGIGPGERIAVLCHNCAAFFEILFGCGKARVVLVPLNWRQTPSELVPLLDDCQPRLLLHDDATAGLAAALAGQRPVPLVRIAPAGEPPANGTYQALTAEFAGSEAWDMAWPSDATWYMLYTSGTTGIPKAVIQTFGMALANHINIGGALDLTSADVTVCFLPLFHTAGINLLALPILIAGGTVRMLPGFDPDAFLDLVDQGRLTALLAVPAVYQALSTHPRFASVELSKVRAWASGGAPLPDLLVRLYAARGAMIRQGYGMTETGPTVFLMDEANVRSKIGSVGKAQMLAEVRLADASGAEVADGETGELLIRGPGVTPGYWNRPEATVQSFTDGWLRTGDVGRRDADGYVYIVDRIKDMYISGGENVYPAEVETVLREHPAVLDASVVGFPDDRWGEVGCAFIVARPGHAVDAAALAAHCRAHLAAYKVPKRIEAAGDLPRTPAGKVMKHVLRNRLTGKE